jgi:hypothetical protein
MNTNDTDNDDARLQPLLIWLTGLLAGGAISFLLYLFVFVD